MRSDESTHLDVLVERLASHLSSSEIFTALFELELSGRIKALPGKYFVQEYVIACGCRVLSFEAERGS